jgi:hypothetical protein
MPNIRLMRKALDYIESNPNLHDQSHWGISTLTPREEEREFTACFAGWVVVLSGWSLVWEPADTVFGTPLYDCRSYSCLCTRGERTDYIADRAQQLLGLGEQCFDYLVGSLRTLEELKVAVDRIEAGLPARPQMEEW